MPTPDEIAAAVNGHCKALRLLGHKDTNTGKIAAALRISPDDVAAAFDGFKITRAKVSDTLSQYTAVATMERFPTVLLNK